MSVVLYDVNQGSEISAVAAPLAEMKKLNVQSICSRFVCVHIFIYLYHQLPTSSYLKVFLSQIQINDFVCDMTNL